MLPMATEPANILTNIEDRHAFRAWLEQHHATERECWVAARRGETFGKWSDCGRLLDYCWNWPTAGRADTNAHETVIGGFEISWNLSGDEAFG